MAPLASILGSWKGRAALISLLLVVIALVVLLVFLPMGRTPTPAPTPTPAASPAPATPQVTAPITPTPTSLPTPTPAPTAEAVAMVELLPAIIVGKVIDTDRKPLEGVKVTTLGLSTETDDQGLFEFDQVEIEEPQRILIDFTKEGYTMYQWPLDVEEGGSYAVEAMVMKIDVVQEVNASADAVVTARDEAGIAKVSLELKAGTLRDDDGNPVTGKVTVELTHGDPFTEPEAFPGGFQATSEPGTRPDLLLDSFGYGRFTIRDEEGREITRIDPENPATVVLRLPDIFQPGGERQGEVKPGDTIPLWYYDQKEGTWLRQDADPSTPEVDDAVIFEENGFLFGSGKTTHTSAINIDRFLRTVVREEEKDPLACIYVTVLSKGGTPLGGVRVTAQGVNYGFSDGRSTDSNGHACIRVPRSTGEKTYRAKVWASVWVPGEGMKIYPDPPLEITTPTAERDCPTACLLLTIQVDVKPWMYTYRKSLWVNNDNDDRDATFDLKDDDVPGENDLVTLRLRLSPAAKGLTVRLSIEKKGTGDVKIWENRNKGKQLPFPVEYKSEDLKYGKYVYIEGIKASSAQNDVKLRLTLVGEPGDASDEEELTVLEIAKVEFEGQGNSINDDDSLDADPHPKAPADAVRVFPGAREEAVIGVTIGDPRDTVTVKVTLKLAPPFGVPVYLKSFDVDDPSSDRCPLDPNDEGSAGFAGRCPGETWGTYHGTGATYDENEDNRGQVGGNKSGQLQRRGRSIENAKGVAILFFSKGQTELEIDLKVTRQPGDNFRVVASHDRNFLSQLRNQDDQKDEITIYERNLRVPPPLVIVAEGHGRIDDKQVSPVLTVWRFLHVERDSMQRIGEYDMWTGRTIAVLGPLAVAAYPAAGNLCVVRVINLRRAGRVATLQEQDQFEGGEFRAHRRLAAGTFNVVGNTAPTVAAQRMFVSPNAAGACPPNNRRFYLYDDDDRFILPKMPDTTLFSLYRSGYVEAVLDGGGRSMNDDYTLGVGFDTQIAGGVTTVHDVNTPDPRFMNQVKKGQDSTWNEAEFWVTYVQSVFQGTLNLDGDPDRQTFDLGFCSSCLDTPGTGLAAALIYQETVRDYALGQAPPLNQATMEQITVVHEVGHSLRMRHSHSNTQIPASIRATLSTRGRLRDIMDYAILSGVNPGFINDYNLSQMRSMTRPGQQ